MHPQAYGLHLTVKTTDRTLTDDRRSCRIIYRTQLVSSILLLFVSASKWAVDVLHPPC